MNTHDIEQERKKFEAFMREKNPSHDLEHEFGIYRFSPVQRHWDTWQAAIEADRQARGEPVLCVSSDAFKRLRAGDDYVKAFLPPTTSIEDMPLYIAPQPAEPVKVPSDVDLLKICKTAGFAFHHDKFAEGSGYGMLSKAYTLENFRALLAKYGNQQIPEGYGTEGLLLLGGDRHHRSCVSPTSDKPTSGAQNEIHAPQNKWEAAIDQELVNTMNCTSDSFKTPAEAITALIDWHITVATDPAVNGGYKLVPIEPPTNCRQRLAKEGKPYPRSSCFVCGKLSPRHRECDAMLDAAPESKGKV